MQTNQLQQYVDTYTSIAVVMNKHIQVNTRTQNEHKHAQISHAIAIDQLCYIIIRSTTVNITAAPSPFDQLYGGNYRVA